MNSPVAWAAARLVAAEMPTLLSERTIVMHESKSRYSSSTAAVSGLHDASSQTHSCQLVWVWARTDCRQARSTASGGSCTGTSTLMRTEDGGTSRHARED